MNAVIRKAIELAGSQESLAGLCRPRISQASVSAYLRGEKTPRISTAKRLQAAVGNKITWVEFVTGIAQSDFSDVANTDQRRKTPDERAND